MRTIDDPRQQLSAAVCRRVAPLLTVDPGNATAIGARVSFQIACNFRRILNTQRGVGDPARVEVEFLQVGQFLEVRQASVGDLGVVEVDFDNFPPFIPLDIGTELHQHGNGIGVNRWYRQLIRRHVLRFMRRTATPSGHTPPHQSLYWWRLELSATFRVLAKSEDLGTPLAAPVRSHGSQ